MEKKTWIQIPKGLRFNKGQCVTVSVSGGKDSTTAGLLVARELSDRLEGRIRNVFADTGWESRTTYEYLRNELPKHIGPIHEISADIQWPKKLPMPRLYGLEMHPDELAAEPVGNVTDET